jgi:hypothetical protein
MSNRNRLCIRRNLRLEDTIPADPSVDRLDLKILTLPRADGRVTNQAFSEHALKPMGPLDAALGRVLAEWRLVEAPELARVQARPLLTQQVDGGDADPQMLRDRPFVEGVGLARQLDLAMQGLVGHA